MNHYGALLLAVTVGALTTAQSAINSSLGKHIGGVGAALVSFLVGTVTLITFYVISGEKGITNLVKVPPHLLIGGIFGAIFVFSMIKLVPQLGASAVMAGVIAGQLLLSLIADQFGLLGLNKTPFDYMRWIGALFLLIGVKLIVR